MIMKPMTKWWFSAIVLVVLGMVGCFNYDPYPKIDMDASVAKLRYGMTYEEVFQVTGKRAPVNRFHNENDEAHVGYFDGKSEWCLNLGFQHGRLYRANKVLFHDTGKQKQEIPLPGAPVHGTRANDYPAEGLNN